MSLKKRIQAGETLFTAWSSIPDPLTAGVLAATDFDAVTLDMQHGGHSEDSILRSSDQSSRTARSRWCASRSGGSTWRAGRWILARRL